MRKQQGLSLIELMISLTLGIVLMTGVMQMFLTSRTTYNTQQAISRIQESGRMAVEFLAQDIRMAGYQGCSSRGANQNIEIGVEDPTNDYLLDFNISIQGYSSDDPPMEDGVAADDTEILVVRRASNVTMPIVGPTGSTANLEVAVEEQDDCVGDVCRGDIAVISDCTQGRVFLITNFQNVGGGGSKIVHARSNIANEPKNIDSQLGGQQFGAGAEILRMSTLTYYIAESGFGAPGTMSLWRDQDGERAELIEGVENMRVLYGVDSNPNDNQNVPDDYREFDDVPSWENVLAVRVELLMQSLQPNVLPDPQPYFFGGETIDDARIDDRRMRQVFSTTIGIRGRLD
ncbi:type IV pilus assembly protein PilW [Marinimicrobium koreense]|uniref:Type IV pilus assembly protein PilW n=1 Tax=Marinimicrobium koreense TaxID=306545 RepID=A0A3N1NNM9_9GAMM|nr:PilW family protein [Marinimicrobium koreense]ROQ17051.1 type IV pilus assembly protein PilW [Marinimicrobium koreense]